ncbi:Serine carboxypeptidase-like 3 [Vitis vinifera]|uniref:Serine carboxypeptidase-like 3 n=1 Tax=Vitis vinifera TaxID=29760 RepID=A0A438GD52_VITVI|nr:Serine carboxypeptidase-like 3 [Vitis vinifera]
MAMASFYLFSSSLCMLFSFVVFTEAAPKGSLITHLPGFNGIFPSKHYSGYVDIGGEPAKNLFYYFVVSERNPAKDPLVLWLNGGPGCSSFDGFVYEHGPFNFEAGKTPISLPTLHLNPYSWSKVSSMIYLDSPTGVGFFLLEKHMAIQNWRLVQRIPGIHHQSILCVWRVLCWSLCATLSAAIVKGIKSGAKPTINFKGYLVGNGVTDMEFDANALVPFTHGMGLISSEMFEKARDNCGGNYYSNESKSCIEELNKIYNDDQVASAWLNDKGVRTAIHAQQKDVIGEWEICTGRLHYSSDSGKFSHENQPPVNCYGSGDHDMCVPFTGSEAWTRSLGYKIMDEWRAWISNDQVAGYTQGYEHGLTFLTIKGAGHTVPEYKPREALDFFGRWLEGKAI